MGILLPCPKCGCADAGIHVNLACTDEFECNECGEEFGGDDVRQFIALWTPVLKWLADVPQAS